jgi:hypothetical protein
MHHNHQEGIPMKKRTLFIRTATLAGVLMIVSLAMAGACLAAGIVAVHGNSGHIEYLDNVANPEHNYLGWGLDIEQKSGLHNWLHYSIPTVPFTKTRYLLVRYETGITGETADSIITNLHVFDGETRIYQNDSVALTGGPAYTIIDMGEDKTISWGLGLTIGIGAGVESMSHRMRIYAVMGEWH